MPQPQQVWLGSKNPVFPSIYFAAGVINWDSGTNTVIFPDWMNRQQKSNDLWTRY